MTTNSKRAIFVPGASVSVGGGHLRRCRVLAEALADRGWTTSFAVTSEAVPLLSEQIRRAFNISIVTAVSPEELKATLSDGCELLVVDHYERDIAFEAACRNWAKTIVAVDDLANRKHDCDILVDQTPGRKTADYAPLVGAGCTVLAGADYALLDPRFRMRRAQPKRFSAEARRVLISFGSTDPAGTTICALEAVERSGSAPEH